MNRHRPRPFPALPACCVCLAVLATTGRCQPPPSAAPSPPSPLLTQPTGGKLATPRETLKTLYFAVLAYDFRPTLIDDAVACLETDSDQPRDLPELARLAVELDAILRELCLPVNAVPENLPGTDVVLYDADGFQLALRRQADRQWRFARETVDRIPIMYHLALGRHRDLQAQRMNLRDDYTDASAAMRRFLMDTMGGDYYAAAQALDLSRLQPDERSEQGPRLAQQLMFVIQRRGWIYFQEVPNNPDGPAYTWHADRDGRIVLERVRQADGKDAWLFTRGTIKNLDKMYQAALNQPPDSHYVLLGKVVPPVAATALTANQQPSSVPAHLASPRTLLKNFFRVMAEAEADDTRLASAIEYLDLSGLAAADRPVVGVKLASKLDAVLRKLAIDLSAVPDSWNAPLQVLGQSRGLRVEIGRQRDGTWRFTRATVEQVPLLFDKLAAMDKGDRNRVGHLETARDTMVSFLGAGARQENGRAARCLDLTDVPACAREPIGPVLALKLKYVIDRIGRVYPQEVPDEPEGPRYVFSNGEVGRIVIARKTDGADKGKWLFTVDTVERIEPMFLGVAGQPIDESLRGSPADRNGPTLWGMPGIWLRLHVPAWARAPAGSLEVYQWIGLALAVLVSWLVARLSLLGPQVVSCWMLQRCGSALSGPFVRAKLRPLTWVCTCWLAFELPIWLDLPVAWLGNILPARTFFMSVLIGWLGFQLIDLAMAIYTNSELLRPHRKLSDMIVPVCMRLLKGLLVVVVLAHMVYHVGHGESLLHFMTGLGAAGLAASLAAQDILKSFFGTLLLIGERSFKLGDRIKVDGHEGIVEQVGFRSTKLRTADDSIVTVPNSTVTAASIDNQGSQVVERHTAGLALGKDLPVEELSALRDRLYAFLHDHPAVIPDETDVSIALHRETGAELQVTFALDDTHGSDATAARQEINYAVLRMVQALHRPVPAATARPDLLRVG